MMEELYDFNDLFKAIDELNNARADYYNGKESKLSDHEYDALEKKVSQRQAELGVELPDNPLDKVGAEPTIPGFKRLRHEYPALSLDKTKDIDAFVNEFRNESVLMWKEDGSTAQLTYMNGNLVLCATRGNGTVGQDITDNVHCVDGVPSTIPYKGKLVVRGEILMSYAEFERIKLQDDTDYANPRNLANSTITMVDRAVAEERKLSFRAFNLVFMEPSLPTFSDRLEFLTRQGFGVVPYAVCSGSIDLKKAMEQWGTRVGEYEFPVDGLVVADNNAIYADSLPVTSEHHRPIPCGYAFKWADEEEETTLLNIELSASRTGLINPVAVFEPVQLEGTTVSRASLSNVSIVNRLNLKPGDRITVFKANKIIPQVSKNLSEHEQICFGEEEHTVRCPACGKRAVVSVSDSGVRTLRCENESCIAKKKEAFVHFASRDGMDIRGLSEKTISKLINAGYLKEYVDFYRLDRYRDAIVHWDGFGAKAVNNMLSAIEASRTNVSMQSFITSLGIPLIGRKQAKLVVEHFKGNINSFLEKAKQGYDFSVIEGFGPNSDNNLNDYFKSMLNNADSVLNHLLAVLEFNDAPVAVVKDNPIVGKTFVVTGDVHIFKNRNELQAQIEQMGGKVTGSVSKKTDFLICNDAENSTSSKAVKSRSLGIPMISEEQFMAMSGLTLRGE